MVEANTIPSTIQPTPPDNNYMMKKETNEVKTTDEGIVSPKQAYKDLEKLIEKYKVKNPVKYAMKKEAFAKQLSELK